MAEATETGRGSEPDRTGFVYHSTLQAILLFLIPGALQGVAIYFLIETVEQADNVAPLIALLMFAFVAPIAHSLTTSMANRIPALLFSIFLGAGTAGLYLVANNAFGGVEETNGHVLLVSIFANLLICYIAAPFFRTVFERRERATHYPSLFEFAWNLPVIGLTAFLFTLAVWLVLGIWSALFNLLSIDFFRDLFFDDMRAWPITLGAFATAIGIVREREGIVLALRNVLFALLKVISPILTSATVLFVVTALVSGLDELWSGWSATTLMVSAIGGAVLLNNAVIGDRGVPENLILRWSVRIQSFVLLVLAIFAVYGIYLRLKEYGITVDRFYAAVIVLFAGAYALAYFLSAVRPRGQDFVRQANISLAGGLFIVAILIQTPVLNPYRIAADDQIARLKSGKVSASDFDYGYLRFNLGNEGERAMTRLAEDESLADREVVLAEIERIRATDGRYDYENDRRQVEAGNTLEGALQTGKLKILPASITLPDDFSNYLKTNPWLVETCNLAEEARCLLIEETQFNADTPQFIFIRSNSDRNVDITLLYMGDNTWREISGQSLYFETATERDELLDRVEAGDSAVGIAAVHTYRAGDRTLFFWAPDISQQNVLLAPITPVTPVDE